MQEFVLYVARAAVKRKEGGRTGGQQAGGQGGGREGGQTGGAFRRGGRGKRLGGRAIWLAGGREESVKKRHPRTSNIFKDRVSWLKYL